MLMLDISVTNTALSNIATGLDTDLSLRGRRDGVASGLAGSAGRTWSEAQAT
jgi:hypothetical protein